MSDETYESPKVTVLGDVTDMTLGGRSKPGIYFDVPYSGEGNAAPPPPGAPGTGGS